jgi:hypothetical protein
MRADDNPADRPAAGPRRGGRGGWGRGGGERAETGDRFHWRTKVARALSPDSQRMSQPTTKLRRGGLCCCCCCCRTNAMAAGGTLSNISVCLRPRCRAALSKHYSRYVRHGSMSVRHGRRPQVARSVNRFMQETLTESRTALTAMYSFQTCRCKGSEFCFALTIIRYVSYVNLKKKFR